MNEDTKQKVREFYDEIGWQQEGDGHYQNTRFEDLRPVSREYIHNTRLRVMNGLIPTGRFLLDAGSGPVQYEEYKTYSLGYQKRVCLDISIQALKQAANGSALTACCVGDLASLPFSGSPSMVWYPCMQFITWLWRSTRVHMERFTAYLQRADCRRCERLA